MEAGNSEARMDRKHTKKVEAERRRRGEINERIEIIRGLLQLNTQMTRIEVLAKAAGTIASNLRGEPIMKENNLPEACGYSAGLNENKSSKALIERIRRRLERQEMQKLEKCLVIHGKLSDVHLLDTAIAVLQAKSEANLNTKSAFTAVLQKGSTSMQREPLKELDPNKVAVFSQEMFSRKHMDLRQFPENPDLPHATAIERKSRIWRPWEGEKTSKFFSFR